jgi:hypothetical protein
MIKPTKYLNLTTCIVNVASLIIANLIKTKGIPLNELEETVIDQLGDDSKYNLLPALNMLFLTGSIDYDDSADVISYLYEGVIET